MAKGPRKHAYERLRRLDLYPQIEERLLSGWPASTLAHWIRFEGNCLDIEKRSLERTLTRLGKSMEAKARVKQEKIYELAEVTVAIRDLEHRIKINMASEDQIGYLLPGTGQDIRRMGELLKISSDLKFDLGVYQRVPRRAA